MGRRNSKRGNDEGASELSPISVRIPDAVRLTGITKTRFYELFKSGEIRPIKLGSTTLLSYATLQAFIAKLEREQGGSSC